MIITICSSASFYLQVNEIADQLIALGHQPLVPQTAKIMKQSGDYDVTHYKTWFDDRSQYDKKAELMRRHFAEIARADAVLVANYEKHGHANYIGPNVLMEMGLAFYLHKPIYILNDLPEGSPFEEELRGFMATLLHGDLTTLDNIK